MRGIEPRPRPSKGRTIARWRFALLLTVLFHTQGCTPLLVLGSAVGFGVTYYWNNISERTFTSEFSMVWDATLKALDTMAIPIEKQEREERRGEIQATTDDLKIDIVLTGVTPLTTRVAVDVSRPHFTRDKATAAEIVEQINAHLGRTQVWENVQKGQGRIASRTPPLPPTNGNTPTVGAAEASPGPALQLVEITASSANVRAAASMSSQILTTLRRGTKLRKITDAPGWVKVRLSSGAEGFIAKGLVQQVETLPRPAPGIFRTSPVFIRSSQPLGVQ